MRKNSPHNSHKGAEKPTSPRLTLRFQSIKSKDDKSVCGGSGKTNDVSSSQPKYQAYCVTMETRDGYSEQKKEDASTTVSSTQNNSSTSAAAAATTGGGPTPRGEDTVSSSSSLTVPGSIPSVNSSPPNASSFPLKDNENENNSNRTSIEIEHPGISSNLEKSDGNDVQTNKTSPSIVGSPPGSIISIKSQPGNISNVPETSPVLNPYDYGSDPEKEEIRRKRRKSNDNLSGPPAKTPALGSSTSLRPHRSPGNQGTGNFRVLNAEIGPGTSENAKVLQTAQLQSNNSTQQQNATARTTVGGSPKLSGKKKPGQNSDTESIEQNDDPENDKINSINVDQTTGINSGISGSTAGTSGQPGGTQNGSPNSPHSPKVPPLKIVIGGLAGGETNCENRERNKVSSSKNVLPYVVAASSSSAAAPTGDDGNTVAGFATTTNVAETISAVTTQQVVNDDIPATSVERKERPSSDAGSASSTPSKSKEEERFQRVTRSSQRMQAALANAGGPATTTTTPGTTGTGGEVVSGFISASSSRNDHSGESSTDEHHQTAGTSNQADVQHPRKRKLKTKEDVPPASVSQVAPPQGAATVAGASSSSSSSSSSSRSSTAGDDPPTAGGGGAGAAQSGGPQQQQAQPQPPQQQQLNCYQMFYNIRKQVDKRRKAMFIVHPKPPQGFKDYLLNRCSYVLEGNAASRISVPTIPPPQTLTPSMKELFMLQEKERYKLRLQHLIEREKLVLSAEQEILRVHGRAARAMANQTTPLSACSILKDEEIYNSMELEQEDKDKNVRSRYNGRLFLSWLQDVDDKWEKIKEVTLLRHHNEAESMQAVQKLDWEWKLKELAMCEVKITPVIDDIHVPMVHVSDDFELLPT